MSGAKSVKTKIAGPLVTREEGGGGGEEGKGELSGGRSSKIVRLGYSSKRQVVCEPVELSHRGNGRNQA